jgi:glycosyltransferase involved in cell wall biosynthesis
MRVALVAEQLLAPVPGGTGRYAAELAAALASTGGSGDQVVGWTAWHRDTGAAKVPGVGGPRRLALPPRALAAAWQRGRGPAPAGADLVHAPTLLLPPRRGIPLVVTIHDAVPWTHPETLTPHGVRWHRAMGERAARDADAVAVPSAATGDDLRRVLPALAGRLHVLGAGVAPALLAEPDAGLAARVAGRLPERYLLSVATVEPRKGLDVLLDALARLGSAAPELILVGQSGWGRLPPANGVRWLGRVPDAELAVVLRQATALVMPSRAEGFGLPVAEAMAVGTPVVCSDAPALVEVADDAALVVPRGDAAALADALSGLLADESLRRRLAAAGLARARRFDWRDVARRAWRLYRELTSGEAHG